LVIAARVLLYKNFWSFKKAFSFDFNPFYQLINDGMKPFVFQGQNSAEKYENFSGQNIGVAEIAKFGELWGHSLERFLNRKPLGTEKSNVPRAEILIYFSSSQLLPMNLTKTQGSYKEKSNEML